MSYLHQIDVKDIKVNAKLNNRKLTSPLFNLTLVILEPCIVADSVANSFFDCKTSRPQGHEFCSGCSSLSTPGLSAEKKCNILTLFPQNKRAVVQTKAEILTPQ